MFANFSGFFLEYGTTAGDQASFASDDTCTVLINLGYRVPFRGTGYRKIYVSISVVQLHHYLSYADSTGKVKRLGITQPPDVPKLCV